MSTLHRDPPEVIERSEWSTSELRRIVVRLSDGDVVQAGTAPSLDRARTLARTLAQEIDRPGPWPRIGDRRLEPETVVSIDVVALA